MQSLAILCNTGVYFCWADLGSPWEWETCMPGLGIDRQTDRQTDLLYEPRHAYHLYYPLINLWFARSLHACVRG